MSILARFHSWRQRRRLQRFRRWLKDNQVVWDGARRQDFRDYHEYFRRVHSIQRTLR